MKKLTLTALMVLALAACGSDGDKHKPDEPKEAKAKITTDNLICPQVAILRQAQDVRDYGGEQAAPDQLVATAHMDKIEGDCGYNKKGIDITFDLQMSATRGPRLGGDKTSFPYFVAVVDPNETILSRQIVTAHFTFSGSDKKAEMAEPLHVFLPLSLTAQQAGPDYRVLVGFKNAQQN